MKQQTCELVVMKQEIVHLLQIPELRRYLACEPPKTLHFRLEYDVTRGFPGGRRKRLHGS